MINARSWRLFFKFFYENSMPRCFLRKTGSRHLHLGSEKFLFNENYECGSSWIKNDESGFLEFLEVIVLEREVSD